MLFNQRIHRGIYILGLATALCALPYSVYVISVGTIILVSNWLLEGGWSNKLLRFKTDKSVWVFGLVYASVFFSFFYSSDIKSALSELRLWLPLLIIPLVVSTSPSLKRNEFALLIILFSIAVFITSIVSISIYLKNFSILGQNVRYLSPFILHIRLAFMVNVSIFSLIYISVVEECFKNLIAKSTLLVLVVWFIIYLFILQSLTGIVVFWVVSALLIVRWALISRKRNIKVRLIAFLTLFIVFSAIYILLNVNRYFQRQQVNFQSLPKTTVNGNEYSQDTTNKQYENGYLIGINICIPELRTGWEKRSKLPFDGTDKANQSLKMTLIRYLTSKGLTKDSIGLANLDSIDIKLIENSVSSVVYRKHKGGVYPRLYQTLWEIDSYKNQGLVGGSSVIQRYIYFKASWDIIKQNFFFGVGTGDRRATLVQYFKTTKLNLPEKYWLNSHNQYLSVWISTGLFGLILFLGGIITPFICKNRFKYFICLVFLTICLLTMLSVDLFEKHLSVSFFALFYSIFFFGYQPQIDVSE